MDYSDSITVKITKVKYEGEFSHWEVDLGDGSGGTAPTFYGVWDMAYELVTGDSGDWGSEHNTWVDDKA